MIATMNAREKTLLAIVGAAVVVLVSVFLIKFFIAQRDEYSKQLATTRAKVETLKKRESERELWATRDTWLTKNVPKLGDSDVASKELREWVLEVAKKSNVIIESPAPSLPSNQPGRTTLALRFEAKGPWDAMFNFLADLQGPDKFTAIENAELKVNREDKTQLKGTLSVARWFAPKQ